MSISAEIPRGPDLGRILTNRLLGPRTAPREHFNVTPPRSLDYLPKGPPYNLLRDFL